MSKALTANLKKAIGKRGKAAKAAEPLKADKPKTTPPAHPKSKIEAPIDPEPKDDEALLRKLEKDLNKPLTDPPPASPIPTEPPQFDIHAEPAAEPAPEPVKDAKTVKPKAAPKPQPVISSDPTSKGVKHSGIEKYWWLLLIGGVALAGALLWRLRQGGTGPSLPDDAGDSPPPEQPPDHPEPRRPAGRSTADQIVDNWFADPRIGGGS